MHEPNEHNPPLLPSPNTPTPRGKQRLDLLLVELGLAATREQARRLIMAGEVLVDEQVSDKPGRTVDRERHPARAGAPALCQPRGPEACRSIGGVSA